jgi:hypothetical protein
MANKKSYGGRGTLIMESPDGNGYLVKTLTNVTDTTHVTVGSQPFTDGPDGNGHDRMLRFLFGSLSLPA